MNKKDLNKIKKLIKENKDYILIINKTYLEDILTLIEGLEGIELIDIKISNCLPSDVKACICDKRLFN